MIAYSRRSGLLRRHRSRSLTLLGLVGLCLLLSCGGERDNEPRPPQDTASGTGDLDTRVFPPASLPFGKDYGAWSAEWWQWAFSMPASENPLLDETGEQCLTAQRGPAWFLAGGTQLMGGSTRHCAVPEGTALFLPIFTVEKDNIGVALPRTETELRDLARSDLDGATDVRIEVDGVAIQHLQLFRFTSPVFSITLPQKNLLQATGNSAAVSGTVFPVVAEGFYVMLKPLSPGRHKIDFGFKRADSALDVTYDVTVLHRGDYDRSRPDQYNLKTIASIEKYCLPQMTAPRIGKLDSIVATCIPTAASSPGAT